MGADRCIFGSECRGTGSAIDPATKHDVDDLRLHIDNFDWLSATDKALIYEGNARRIFRIPPSRSD